MRESRPITLAKDWPASDSDITVATVADDDTTQWSAAVLTGNA